MKSLLSAARALLADLASTILFYGVYALSHDTTLAVALGLALAAAQIGWNWLRKKPVDTLQWISAAVVLLSVPLFWFSDHARPAGRAPFVQPPTLLRAARRDRYPAPAAAGAMMIFMPFPYSGRVRPALGLPASPGPNLPNLAPIAGQATMFECLACGLRTAYPA